MDQENLPGMGTFDRDTPDSKYLKKIDRFLSDTIIGSQEILALVEEFITSGKYKSGTKSELKSLVEFPIAAVVISDKTGFEWPQNGPVANGIKSDDKLLSDYLERHTFVEHKSPHDYKTPMEAIYEMSDDVDEMDKAEKLDYFNGLPDKLKDMLASNSESAYWVAVMLLNGRWPKGEAAIMSNRELKDLYTRFVSSRQEQPEYERFWTKEQQDAAAASIVEHLKEVKATEGEAAMHSLVEVYLDTQLAPFEGESMAQALNEYAAHNHEWPGPEVKKEEPREVESPAPDTASEMLVPHNMSEIKSMVMKSLGLSVSAAGASDPDAPKHGHTGPRKQQRGEGGGLFGFEEGLDEKMIKRQDREKELEEIEQYKVHEGQAANLATFLSPEVAETVSPEYKKKFEDMPESVREELSQKGKTDTYFDLRDVINRAQKAGEGLSEQLKGRLNDWLISSAIDNVMSLDSISEFDKDTLSYFSSKKTADDFYRVSIPALKALRASFDNIEPFLKKYIDDARGMAVDLMASDPQVKKDLEEISKLSHNVKFGVEREPQTKEEEMALAEAEIDRFLESGGEAGFEAPKDIRTYDRATGIAGKPLAEPTYPGTDEDEAKVVEAYEHILVKAMTDSVTTAAYRAAKMWRDVIGSVIDLRRRPAKPESEEYLRKNIERALAGSGGLAEDQE